VLRGRPGFTLFELVLAISLMLLLAGVIIISFAGSRRIEGLDEGAARFEAALRMTRAEAAGAGRRFCLILRDQDAAFRVMWEPEPLTAPGEFVPYTRSTWPEHLPSGIVEVTRLELTGPSVYRVMGIASSPFKLVGMDAKPEDLDLLMFHADGSSDSGLVELATTDPADQRRAVVEVDGRTGTVTSQVLTPTELEEFYKTRAAGAT